jgi:hypothetical protein
MRKGQALVVLFGLWLAVSPWVVGYAHPAHAMLDSIVGVLAVVAGGTSVFMGLSTSVPLWAAFVLGVLTYFAPMMFNLAGASSPADNDIVVGPIIALGAAIALVAREKAVLLLGPPDPEGAEGQATP